MTKSEPGANSVEQLAEKQKNIGMASSKKTFLLKINVFKTKRAYNKPPETAFFCYTENNNKKALTSIIQDKKTIIKLSKQTLSPTFPAVISTR